MIFSEKLKKYRMNQSEYDLAKKLVGRDLKEIEWPLFSALWSEHCSYKTSKNHLRKFSYRNSRTPNIDGENAGLVDLGNQERIVFKMESHNHPSFIEPFQGAATGVGGILRDIFTMGARPIALANYLCFGEPGADRMRDLIDGVVKGISSYGNCVGVPTVTGQTEFHPEYNKNILVNAMAVGLLTGDEKLALSRGQTAGSLVVYVGAKTGKDGVHGASMASESFGEDSEAKKPNVQIGDPFYEKLLIEACLEVIHQDLVLAIQDMGAAGLTSSSFEMASKSQMGLELRLDQVPIRDSSLTPEEILLSESQERMLLMCEPAKFDQIQKLFHRWGLEASILGKVIPEKLVKIYWHNELLTEIDPDLLVENAPRYDRAFEIPTRRLKIEKQNLNESQIKEKFLSFFAQPRFWNRSPIYRQYDQRVGTRTMKDATQSVAFLKLPSQRELAIAVGCRPEIFKQDVLLGSYDAVFYPALQMAIKGAKVLALTDCLNFGNPEKKDIMGEFALSVASIAEAAKVLDAPVISGNVSFYNETDQKGIPPTPAIGAVGLREAKTEIPSDQFQKENLKVYSLQIPFVTVESNSINIENLRKYLWQILLLGEKINFASSKMVGKGGTLWTLLQMSQDGVGITLQTQNIGQLCQEDFYRVIVAISPEQEKQFQELLKDGLFKNSFELLGTTKNNSFQITQNLKWNLQELRMKHKTSAQEVFGEFL